MNVKNELIVGATGGCPPKQRGKVCPTKSP